MLQPDWLHYLALLSAGKMCMQCQQPWHLTSGSVETCCDGFILIIHTLNNITIFHADNNIEIFQVQFGFPQFPVPGIFYSATVQPHHGVRYFIQGKLNDPNRNKTQIFSQYLLVDNEASSPSSLWIWSLPNVLLTSFSLQLLIALPTSFFPVRLVPDRLSPCLSFIWFILISTFHFQMVLSSSQRLHTRPGHLHGDADHLHPDGHHQHVHPPHLHPPLHVYGALPHLLLRDVVAAAEQILWVSLPGHGEADWTSVWSYSCCYRAVVECLLVSSSLSSSCGRLTRSCWVSTI